MQFSPIVKQTSSKEKQIKFHIMISASEGRKTEVAAVAAAQNYVMKRSEVLLR
jgi:hypothetical protein